MSLLNYKIPQNLSSGNYQVTLADYREIEPIFEPNSDTILFKPYILLTLNIVNPNQSITVITDKIYDNRIPYFFNCINKQFNYEFVSSTLDQILSSLIINKPFQINVSYDPRYGRQINYFPIP